ncbi:hypothetical protein AAKU64_000015 [Undibacterium sp. GrIS 1.8]|uniref:hypothetical protein n=1 Tax=unclassified Undibacterium TaxID=2630295 RepID=UPI0033972FA9
MPPSLANMSHDELRRRLTITQLTPLIQKTMIRELGDLPYPVEFRNSAALEGWQRILNSNESGKALLQRWSKPEFTCEAGMLAVENFLFSLISLDRSGDAERWRSIVNGIAIHISSNLLYARRQGTLIETTAALETLLTHADVDQAFPMGMLALPFAAQYLRFGDQAAHSLPCFFEDAEAVADGVFCFVSNTQESLDTQISAKQLQLIFVIKRHNRHHGFLRLEHPIESPQMLLSDWVRQLADKEKSIKIVDQKQITDLVNYVAKVFLYLGLKEARHIQINDYSDAQQRMQGIGPKKQAKLGRKITSLYDRIMVGPQGLIATHQYDVSGHAVAPHWRRGHFRMQTHGVGSKERKLIFVAPVLVRADRLKDEQPSPKAYRAGQQTIKNLPGTPL